MFSTTTSANNFSGRSATQIGTESATLASQGDASNHHRQLTQALLANMRLGVAADADRFQVKYGCLNWCLASADQLPEYYWCRPCGCSCCHGSLIEEDEEPEQGCIMKKKQQLSTAAATPVKAESSGSKRNRRQVSRPLPLSGSKKLSRCSYSHSPSSAVASSGSRPTAGARRSASQQAQITDIFPSKKRRLTLQLEDTASAVAKKQGSASSSRTGDINLEAR